jgi:hypothetical protein
MEMARSMIQPTSVQYSTASGAVTGLVLWALGTYVFHNSTPAAVTAAAYVLIPAAVSGIAAFWTRSVTRTTMLKDRAVSDVMPRDK